MWATHSSDPFRLCTRFFLVRDDAAVLQFIEDVRAGFPFASSAIFTSSAIFPPNGAPNSTNRCSNRFPAGRRSRCEYVLSSSEVVLDNWS